MNRLKLNQEDLRSLIIGGFPCNAEKAKMQEWLTANATHFTGAQDTKPLYTLGSAAKLIFNAEGDVWTFLKAKRALNYHGAPLWFTPVKTEEEKISGSCLSKIRKAPDREDRLEG